MSNPRELQIIQTAEKPWDAALKFRLLRYSPMPMTGGTPELMEPGVNFFILALEALGCTTYFSCEGHPTGFYVAFDAPLEIADRIQRCGWLSVERHNQRWIIRLPDSSIEAGSNKVIRIRAETARKYRLLRQVAKAWQKKLLEPLIESSHAQSREEILHTHS